MKTIRTFGLIGSLAALPILGGADIALAQLDELVVTARKREESLLDIPVAVTAFSSEQLYEQGSIDLKDVARLTPGVFFQDQALQQPGRTFTAIRFRGLGSEIVEPFGQTGSAFVDGVFIAGGVSSLGTQNFERIEVIKGPSSAVFGRSTFAGAVNFITPTPSLEEYSFGATGRFAQDDTYDVTGTVDGPIIPGVLGGRFFVRGYGTGGQYESFTDGGALGEESTQTIMGTLYAEPVSGFNVKFRAIYSNDDDGPPPGMFLGGPGSRRGMAEALGASFTNSFDVRPELAGLTIRNDGVTPLSEFFIGEIPVVDLDRWTDSNTILSETAKIFFRDVVPTLEGVPEVDDVGLKREQQRFALTMNWDISSGLEFFDNSTITSITAYDLEQSVFIRDFEFTGFQNWLSREAFENESWFQEVRWTSDQDRPFRWSLGVSYFDAKFTGAFSGGEVFVFADGVDAGIASVLSSFDVDVNAFGGTSDGLCPCAFAPFDLPPVTQNKTVGVFGGVSYDFTDWMTLDFEWRWQRDRILQRSTARASVSNPIFEEFLTGRGTEFGGTFTAFLPRITLSVKPTEDKTLWFTYSESNNPGYFNDQIVSLSEEDFEQVLANIPNVELFLDEETLENWEIGVKGSTWENRITYSMVAYYMQWGNQKTRTAVPITRDDGSQNIQNSFVSGFSTDLYGIEFEGSVAITENLVFNGSFNWAEAEFQDFSCGFTDDFSPADPVTNEVNCDGNRPVQYPKWTGAFAMTWTDQLMNSDWDYYGRFDGNYTGKRFIDEQNFGYIGSAWLFNIRAGVQNENFTFEIFTTNLFNNDQYIGGARWTDFSSDGSTGGLFPFQFAFQQGVVLTPAIQRQVGVRAAINF